MTGQTVALCERMKRHQQKHQTEKAPFHIPGFKNGKLIPQS
jgi:hypothetical protein